MSGRVDRLTRVARKESRLVAGDAPPARAKRSRLVYLLSALAALAVVAAVVNFRYVGRSEMRQHLNEGIRLYQAGKEPEAIEQWRAAMRSDPTHPDAYRLLAQALTTGGHPDEALPLLRQLEKIAPNSPGLYSQLAEAEATIGNGTDAAFNAAKRAVEKEPDSANAHALYGIQLSEQEKHAEAVSELTRAITLAPGDDRIAVSLAQAQLGAADVEGGVKTLETVITRSPGDAKAHYLLGWAYARRTPTPENLAKATAAFEKARTLNPEQKEIPAELGRLKILARDYRGAIAPLETAWKQGPPTDEIAYNLSKAYRATGDAARATQMSQEFKRLSDAKTTEAELRKRLALDSKDVVAATQLAELQVQTQNWEEAGPLIQTLLRIRPDDERVLRAAARLYAGVGDTQSAAVFEERLRGASKSAADKGAVGNGAKEARP